MADTKISNLTEVTGPVVGDFLAVVDAATTKKVQIANIIKFKDWQLIASQALNGAASYNFTGLASYDEVRVLVQQATFGSTSICQVRVSIDNGVSFKTTSGDYVGISGAGAETNGTSFGLYNTAATAARSAHMLLMGLKAAAPKWATSIEFFSGDSIGAQYAATLSAITAIQLLNSAAVNFTGGTAYVFAR